MTEFIIDEFANYLTYQRRYSSNTVKSYTTDLDMLSKRIEAHFLHPADVFDEIPVILRSVVSSLIIALI